MPPFHEEQLFRRAIAGDQQQNHNIKYQQPPTSSSSSRTQHKLQLQRLSFLTNDKNYLDHPKNMKRLTKELDRVNREYRCVRRYEDPVTESFKRLNQKATACAKSIQPQTNNTASSITPTTISRSSHSSSNSSSSNSSSNSSSYSSSAEQNSFIGRWFAPNEHLTDIHSVSQNASMTDSVAYSFHPTIANNMKRRTNKH